MSVQNASSFLATARVWHHIDVKDVILGRVATQIALTLMGKHKPVYHPAADVGDYVVVTNAEKIMLTGRKLEQKTYYKNTGYVGNGYEIPVKKMLENTPERVLYKAVKGMLPKNRLTTQRLNRLKIFAGENHPYKANIMRSYI